MDTTSLVDKHSNKPGEKLALSETNVSDVKKADFQHHKSTQQWLQFLVLFIQNETRAQHEQMQREVRLAKQQILRALASREAEEE